MLGKAELPLALGCSRSVLEGQLRLAPENRFSVR